VYFTSVYREFDELMSERRGRYEKAYDDYSIIMVKALADRLAEVILHYIPQTSKHTHYTDRHV